MNHRAVLNLRSLFEAQLPFPDPKDPRNRTVFRRLKRAYNDVPRPDRHPDRLHNALAAAINNLSLSPATS